jgi:hypothetical protein
MNWKEYSWKLQSAITQNKSKSKSKAIPVTGREGP